MARPLLVGKLVVWGHSCLYDQLRGAL